MEKLALISVFDKKGVVAFAKKLQKLGWGLVCTGGTYKTLRRAKLDVTPIDKITGSPEILDGRVKTISYQAAAGILFDRDNERHQREIRARNLPQIDMVVVNLYPFEETISKKHTFEEALEMIDIGGVTLLRAAAKNYRFVTALTDPRDYPSVIEELEKQGEVSLKTKEKLASKVFWKTSDYDDAIDGYLAKKFLDSDVLKMAFCKGRGLRYGENPHQEGWFYKESISDPLALQNFRVAQGKELSFNNILDISAAIDSIAEIGQDQPACVVIKHGSPAGAAVGGDIEKVYNKAWYEGDPLAAFGGVIAANREVDRKLALKILSQKGEKKFFEVLVAPSIVIDALQVLFNRKNLIVLTNPSLKNPRIRAGKDYKYIRGGILAQNFDSRQIREKDLKVVTKKKPTKKQVEDLLFAWKMVKMSKSNAIAIVKNQTLISSGVGQQDRKEAARIAVYKATDPARNKNKKTPAGAVAASDAFFPFADGPEILIKAGIKAIVQPGGSIRDQETIDLCNKCGTAMVFTSIRAFKH